MAVAARIFPSRIEVAAGLPQLTGRTASLAKMYPNEVGGGQPAGTGGRRRVAEPGVGAAQQVTQVGRRRTGVAQASGHERGRTESGAGR